MTKINSIAILLSNGFDDRFFGDPLKRIKPEIFEHNEEFRALPEDTITAESISQQNALEILLQARFGHLPRHCDFDAKGDSHGECELKIGRVDKIPRTTTQIVPLTFAAKGQDGEEKRRFEIHLVMMEQTLKLLPTSLDTGLRNSNVKQINLGFAFTKNASCDPEYHQHLGTNLEGHTFSFRK
ncbi:MAG: hypothetical protein HC902_09480 [Calothrix sp. SM1_5_4]|nr:hypothetical protein [Calothrix sp. SM1_5_4]